MRPDPRDEGKRWLQQARQDIDDAQYNQAGGRYHLTCFLAQQASTAHYPAGRGGIGK